MSAPNDDDDDDGGWDEQAVVEVPITDELDLHTFAPKEIKELVPDYLDECVARGYREVRIVHGKGVGNLRRLVHACLDRHAAVVDYRLADETRGQWGATLVRLCAGPAGEG